MRSLWENRTVRGLGIIALIALVIVVLQLEATLAALFLLMRIAFFLAIAYFVFLVWRERRADIGAWSTRAQVVFYGAAGVALLDLAQFFVVSLAGLNALAFFLVLAGCGYAMWKVWRDRHTYS